jgi:hypothetical protein
VMPNSVPVTRVPLLSPASIAFWMAAITSVTLSPLAP